MPGRMQTLWVVALARDNLASNKREGEGVFRRFIITIAALWGCASTGFAQNPNDARWSDAVTVVVHAPPTITVHGRCPAMWRLSRGGASVWVLPVLLDARGDGWDTGCFTRALKGANVLLLNSPYTGVKADYRYLRAPLRLKDVVPPETYARYVAAARRVHEDPGRYDVLTPAWAAYPLYGDAYEAHFHHESAPADTAGMARRRNVAVQYIPFFDGGPRLRNARNGLDLAGQEACLNSMLDRLDFTLGDMDAEIRAWKRGDLATVLKLFPKRDDRCTPPDVATDVPAENSNRWTQGVMDALDKPGKSIAVIPLDWFLDRGGVLDQLRAAGVEVAPPSALQDAP